MEILMPILTTPLDLNVIRNQVDALKKDFKKDQFIIPRVTLGIPFMGQGRKQYYTTDGVNSFQGFDVFMRALILLQELNGPYQMSLAIIPAAKNAIQRLKDQLRCLDTEFRDVQKRLLAIKTELADNPTQNDLTSQVDRLLCLAQTNYHDSKQLITSYISSINTLVPASLEDKCTDSYTA